MLFEIGAEFIDNRLLHKAAHVGGAELALRLAFVLRVGNLYGNDRGYTLAHVVARKLFFFFDYAQPLTRVVYYLVAVL